MIKATHGIDLKPVKDKLSTGETVYWYNIQQLEEMNYRDEMARLDRMFNRFKRNENNTD